MNTREKLVDAIITLAGDEYQDRHSLILLAKMDEEELIDNLISIAEYYKDESYD